MCFFIEIQDSKMFYERRPGDEVALRTPQDWIIPKKAVLGIFLFGVVFTLLGIVLVAVGGGALPWGSVFLGLGLCCLTVCSLLAIHAFCIVYRRQASTQTSEKGFFDDSDREVIPTYAVIDKKPLQTGHGPDHSPDVVMRDGSPTSSFPPKQVSVFPAGDQSGCDRPDFRSVPQGSPQARPPVYGLHSSQPTPYSTLPGMQPVAQVAPHSYRSSYQSQPTPHQSSPETHKGPFQGQTTVPQPLHGYKSEVPEEYDNEGESTPMIHSNQPQSQHPIWRPSYTGLDQDSPEPQRLVHPSEKRPMTFDQISSSKISIYDNVQFSFTDNEI